MSIQIRSTIKQAWHAVRGSKRAFFCCFLALGLVQAILLCVQEEFNHLTHQGSWSGPAITILMWFMTAPIMAGFLMIGLHRARSQAVKWKSGLLYFKSIFPLFSAYFISMLTTWFSIVGSLYVLIKLLNLFISVPSISAHYPLRILIAITLCLITFLIITAINLFFSFNALLILDRKLPFYTAVKHSIIMTAKNFISFYGLTLLLILCNLIGACLFGIGLIWTIPLTYISIAVVYEKIYA
jgi:hypothetical protein